MSATAPAGTATDTVASLRAIFGAAVLRHATPCGDHVVWVENTRAHEILAWLRDTPGQDFDYLTDITAVEYRDPELPLEVVYQLRSLDRKVDLRVKVPLDKAQPLAVDTVYDLWKGADWLEREVYDMFGVSFTGHPDLRASSRRPSAPARPGPRGPPARRYQRRPGESNNRGLP